MKPATCDHCLKPAELCVCEFIRPLAQTKVEVLILQHPQEPDKELGTARLAHLLLPNSKLKIGLSWPNLKKAAGREVQSSAWAVLYLGSGIRNPINGPGLFFVGKKGDLLPGDESKTPEGIVILDGTWSQAKALWWRNPWLLKLRRAILVPRVPSLYRELRKEPRKECLSTLETIAFSLAELGENSEVSQGLVSAFEILLKKKRSLG